MKLGIITISITLLCIATIADTFSKPTAHAASKINPKTRVLSDKQILDGYKKILSNEDLMEDFDNDYIDMFPDFSDKARKLVIEIYNENQSGFESLRDTVKAEVYNAIFYAAASISKPEIYGGITAKEKLNTAMFSKGLKIKVGGKLSQLKSFFDTHGEEFEKLAKNNSKELKKKLAVIAQKEERVAQKEEKLAQKEERVAQKEEKLAQKEEKLAQKEERYKRYSDKVDNLTKMVRELQGLLGNPSK